MFIAVHSNLLGSTSSTLQKSACLGPAPTCLWPGAGFSWNIAWSALVIDSLSYLVQSVGCMPMKPDTLRTMVLLYFSVPWFGIIALKF